MVYKMVIPSWRDRYKEGEKNPFHTGDLVLAKDFSGATGKILKEKGEDYVYNVIGLVEQNGEFDLLILGPDNTVAHFHRFERWGGEVTKMNADEYYDILKAQEVYEAI